MGTCRARLMLDTRAPPLPGMVAIYSAIPEVCGGNSHSPTIPRLSLILPVSIHLHVIRALSDSTDISILNFENIRYALCSILDRALTFFSSRYRRRVHDWKHHRSLGMFCRRPIQRSQSDHPDLASTSFIFETWIQKKE